VKSGFIAIIGRPNVGKSTLLNRLIGFKISIVSDKPQTTRNRILGVTTTDTVQMIFVDTPGIHRPGFRLNQRMMDAVYESIRDVDLLIHMVDASERFGKGERFVLDLVGSSRKPSFLFLNKIDLINKGKLLPIIEFYSKEEVYDEIIPGSALDGQNIDLLVSRISDYLPTGEALYPSEYLTDQQERSIVGELIREKVLLHSRQELPYSVAVLVEEFEEGERESGFVRIAAAVIVEKDGQKKIIVGRGGQMIKRIGTDARKEIEAFLQVRRIYLDLKVKVIPGWRNREGILDDLGVR
jgi:GTP-binding protein Era